MITVINMQISEASRGVNRHFLSGLHQYKLKIKVMDYDTCFCLTVLRPHCIL
jgi:hypothetical protein